MDMRAVFDKIAESLEGDISIEPDWQSEHVGVLPEDRVRIDPEVWRKWLATSNAGKRCGRQDKARAGRVAGPRS